MAEEAPPAPVNPICASSEAAGRWTISGPARDSRGCLLELTRRGAEPIALPTGESRTFLEDGDEVRDRAGVLDLEAAASARGAASFQDLDETGREAAMASIARLTRSAMLEVLRADYVRTARAKGLREQVVARLHDRMPLGLDAPRDEVFYFSDDADLMALRYHDWKVVFMEQRAPGLIAEQVTGRPLLLSPWAVLAWPAAVLAAASFSAM